MYTSYGAAGSPYSIPLREQWAILGVQFPSSNKTYHYWYRTRRGRLRDVPSTVQVLSPFNGWVTVEVVSKSYLYDSESPPRHKEAIPSTSPLPATTATEARVYPSAPPANSLRDMVRTINPAIAMLDFETYFPATQRNTEKQQMKIEITTPTLLNGRDIKSYTNEELFTIITNKENRLKELNGIGVQPKALVEEKEKITTELSSLVAAMDAR